jgi:hypothetical protein
LTLTDSDFRPGSSSKAVFTFVVNAVSVVYSPADSCVGVDEQPAVMAMAGTAQTAAITRRAMVVLEFGIFLVLEVDKFRAFVPFARFQHLQQVLCHTRDVEKSLS